MTSEIINTYNFSINKLCPECGGTLINNGFEIVCQNCGLVINSISFINSYQINENNDCSSCSSTQFVSIGNTVDNICTLGSHIDYFSKYTFYDYKKKLIPAEKQKKFSKLKKFYSLSSKIKNHETDYRILKILTQICEYLNISTLVKNRAAYLYHEIKKKAPNIVNHVSLIGFCIFQASKENKSHSPVSLKELCKIFSLLGHRINPKLIIRDYLHYQNFIEIRIKPHQSEDFISRFINDIVNSKEILKRMKIKNSKWQKEEYRRLLHKKSLYILKQLNAKKRGSRNPYILAATVVYCADRLIAKEFQTKPILTQKTASNAMNIAEYSIRDHYVKILKPFFLL
ncbi:hypothetical protein [Candidatus Harpocratesius sp.]